MRLLDDYAFVIG
jgi:hypothetical protein